MESTKGPALDSFRAFLTEDWRQWLAEYPELATSFGFPGFDDRWTDDSPQGIERRKKHLAESLASVRRIDGHRLPESERTNYALYRDLLEVADRGIAFGLDPLPFQLGMPRSLRVPLNQMDGIHLTVSETLEVQPREHLSDYENTLSRLNSLGTAVEQNLALLEEGLRLGYTPYRVSIQGVPDQVRGLIPDDPMSSPLLQAFTELPSRIGESDRRRLVPEARTAYLDRIVPAFERFHRYLVTTYLPRCTDIASVSARADGGALYEHLVRLQTTTDLAPQEIHEIGRAEVRRLRSAMQALMGTTGFTGTLAEFFEFLRTDERFCFPTAEALVDGYRIIAKKTDPGLARLFGRLPRLPYGVLPVPEFRSKVSPTAYYMPGAPTTGRAGTFYANTYDLSARRRWEMEALCLHEAVPGHHLQIALAQEVEDLPEFRRHTGPTAFVEGWGLYAESLGEELGHYRDPYSKMGEYVYDMWRSIRLVVDTGIHALGWTRDDAIRFFRENTGKSEVDIAVEVDRYIVWPGQALAYKMGQLKFRELRSFAERELGERFDVRAFHDRVLEEGALPLGMVDARVRAWVAQQANAASPPASGPSSAPH